MSMVNDVGKAGNDVGDGDAGVDDGCSEDVVSVDDVNGGCGSRWWFWSGGDVGADVVVIMTLVGAIGLMSLAMRANRLY